MFPGNSEGYIARRSINDQHPGYSKPVPGKSEHRSSVRKKFLAGAIGVGLMSTMAIGSAGYAAYAALDKTVTLTVDGETRTMHTFANTVGEVLESEELGIGSRDMLSPQPDRELRDGTEISVRYARPLTVTVDGETSKHWVTALDVDAAMRQLDIRSSGAAVSVSRSKRIDRDGLDFEVRTPKRFTVVADGDKKPVTAPVLTVSEALDAADLKLDEHDTVTPKPKARISAGDTIRVRRIEKKIETRTVDLSYETIRKADGDLYEDETEVRTAGSKGEQRQRVRITIVDGKKKDVEILSRKTLDEPVARTVAYGTKERPSSGGNVGGDVDSLNWAALAECESGGNPQAVNPAGYYGLYQFSLPTWQSVGGSGNPTDASSDEQTYRAKLLYQKAGDGQWPVCGSNLYE